MTSEQFARAERLFKAACDLPVERRLAFVENECADDTVVLRTLKGMLSQEEHAPSYLETPALGQGFHVGGVENMERRLRDEIAAGGRYLLLEPLGEGGFGTVYRAEQSQPVHRTVALKVVKPGMDTRRIIARFGAERQALARMDHPGIARIYDAGATESGRPYFVMELVEGVPLTRYCDSHKLTLQQRLDLFIQVCRAAQHAHQKGIIHRDIKPSNVLVTNQDGRPTPKLIDFGIAQAMDVSERSRTLLTEHGQLIGTPEYMSPEQAGGHHDIDTRADIYALGVLLFELLTGTTPFDRSSLKGGSPADLHRVICEQEPPAPSARVKALGAAAAGVAEARRTDPASLIRELRGDLDWIVFRALEKDRSRRYETADALAADVDRHLKDEAVSARAPTASYRFRKFARRNRGTLAAGVVIAFLLVAGVVATSIGWVQALTARASEAEQRRRADAEAAVARAVNAFLNQDLLASVAPEQLGKDVGMIEVLDAASRRIEGRFGDQSEVEATIRLTLGTTYRSLGQYPAAEGHLERAYHLRRERAGADAPATLECAVALIDLRLAQGRFDEAEVLLSDALERLRRVAGEDHPDTVRALSHLGRIQTARGLLPEAVASFERALGSARRTLGPRHGTTLDAMKNLAVIYGRVERTSEAEALYLESLAGMRTLHGEAHPTTLAALNDLALFYQRRGCPQEAAALFLEALTLKRRVLGEEHPETVDTANGLANLYKEAGRFAEAEAILGWSLLALRRSVGVDHPRTLTCANTLASVYLALKRYEEAEAICSEALAHLIRRFGDEPRTIVGMSTLAQIYEAQDRYEEAEPLHVRVLGLVMQIYGEGHRETLTARNNLANVYQAQERLEEAESLLADVVAAARNSFPPGHWDLGSYLASHGVVLRKLGRYEESEKALLEAHAIFAAALGGNHPRTSRAAGSLVKLYEAWNHPGEAARWRMGLASLSLSQPGSY